MRIYLIGMPASGKSRTGSNLAKLLNYEYVDTDQLIEEAHGPIPDIFAFLGENVFRDYEKEALKKIKSDNVIVSCGGGITKDISNRDLMRPGIIIYLDSSIEKIKEHLSYTKAIRPVLKDKSVEELYSERIDNYLRFMDFKAIYTDYEDTSKRIYNLINNYNKKKILVINGPNLNLLGKRNPNHYGIETLDDINNLIKKDESFDYEFYQNNVEGLLIDKLQEYEKFSGIIFNPGGYTHTSVAIHDTLEVINVLKVEVHLSDVDNREDYRKINFVRDVCDYTCMGKHEESYIDAVVYLKNNLNVI